MNDFLRELDEDFADDPDYQSLSETEKRRIVSVLEKMMDMGIGAVYGDEDEDIPDADAPCDSMLGQCEARCCGFVFALTRQEAEQGVVEYNRDKPFFIARDDDGLCPHLDRDQLQCKIWDNRPLRCRRYDCRNDTEVWPEGFHLEQES